MDLKIILALALSALFMTAALAYESVDLGPYQVSFELDLDCPIEVAEPVYGKTYAGIDYVDRSIALSCDEGWAKINVTAYQSPVQAGDVVTASMSRKSPPGIGSISIETREQLIDRHSGFFTTFVPVTGNDVYQVVYWPDRYILSGECMGQVSCKVASNLPWSKTRALFETFHVGQPSPESSGETVNAGPYQVSFDLGEIDYSVAVEGPIVGTTPKRAGGEGYETYKVTLKSDSKAASIEITSYESPKQVSLEGEKLVIESSLKAEGFSSVRVTDRNINDIPAVLVTGEKPERVIYKATYWPDQSQQNCETFGMTVCKINSDYKWAETQRLLDSFQVTWIESAKSAIEIDNEIETGIETGIESGIETEPEVVTLDATRTETVVEIEPGPETEQDTLG